MHPFHELPAQTWPDWVFLPTAILLALTAIWFILTYNPSNKHHRSIFLLTTFCAVGAMILIVVGGVLMNTNAQHRENIPNFQKWAVANHQLKLTDRKALTLLQGNAVSIETKLGSTQIQLSPYKGGEELFTGTPPTILLAPTQ